MSHTLKEKKIVNIFPLQVVNSFFGHRSFSEYGMLSIHSFEHLIMYYVVTDVSVLSYISNEAQAFAI